MTAISLLLKHRTMFVKSYCCLYHFDKSPVCLFRSRYLLCRPVKSSSISVRRSRDNVDGYLHVAMVAAADWRRDVTLKINAVGGPRPFVRASLIKLVTH